MGDDASLLLDFVRSRSHAAFAELVARHVDAVYSAALRRVGGDSHLAEDVTQQVFIALAGKAHQLTHHPLISGWLHRAACHQAANAVRAECRRKLREQEVLNMHESSEDPTPRASWSQVAPFIDDAIDQLNDRDRTAILLRYIENQPFREIGDALRISEDAARMRVDRALDKLRNALRRRGVETSFTALSMSLTSHAVIDAPANLEAAALKGALSGLGSASATTSSTFLHLMITSKFTPLVTGAVLLIAASSAGFQIHQRAEAESSEARAAWASDAIRTRLAVQRRRLATLEGELMANGQSATHQQRSSHSTPQGTATVVTQTTATTSATKDPISRGRDLIERHPEVKTALLQFFDAQTDTRFGALYREFNLSPGQIERFRALHRAYYSYAQSLSDGDEMFQFNADGSLSSEENDRQIQQLLGPERYKRLQQYAADSAPREETESIASALALIEPLTSGQAQQLQSFLAAAKIESPSGPTDFDWDRVAAQTTALLTPAQREVLVALKKQHQLNAAIALANTAQSNSDNASTP